MSDPADLASNESYVIKVVKQPPEYVHSEEWFEVALVIERSASESEKSTSTAVDVNVASYLTVYPGGNDSSGNIFCNGASLVTNPEMICLSLGKSREKSKTTNVKCKIKSRIFEDKITQYSIFFSPTSTKPTSIANNISFASLTPIQIVSAKIVTDDKNWQDVWFKDEGGRDKSMEAKVSLVDASGNIVKDRRIPLTVTLLYDNELSTKVMKQETLRILSSPRHFIDPQTGECTVQFRIEDVSKNHQGQNFKLEITPDVTKVFDIARTCTPPVSIRSKRNKRLRSATSRNDNDNYTPPHPNRRSGGGATTPSIGGVGNIPTFHGSAFEKTMGLTGVPDIQRLRQAMKGVIDWTEEIINGLYPLKWQLIGYAQFPDGSVDYNRPYHSMSNPNEYITRMLSRYSEQTRYHLQMLKHAVENTKETRQQGFQSIMMNQGDQTSQMAYGSQGSSTAMMNRGKPSMMGSMIHHYGMPQVSSDTFMSPNNHNSHVQQHNSMSQFSSPVMGRHSITSHQVPQHPPNDRSFHHNQHLSPLDSDTQNRGVSHHHDTSMHMMNRPHDEDLERMQDDKVEEEIEAERRQKKVEYILAKQFKSIRTGEQLGFPAFNSEKVIIGFYRESTMKVGVGRFVPLSKHKDEFGPRQMAQATLFLEDAIENNNSAVHSLRDWGSLQSMIDHTLVYAWSKDLSPGNDGSPKDKVILEIDTNDDSPGSFNSELTEKKYHNS